MKQTVTLFLIGCFFVGLTNLHAQQTCCGFDVQQERMLQIPEAQETHLESQRRLKAKKLVQHEGKYIIPVVFHVFGETYNGGKKVNLALLQDALEKTNKDFQGLTADYHQNDPSSRFEEIKKPLEVEFRLAQLDPKGRPTIGVEFYNKKSGFGNSSGYDNEIRKYAWDNTKYMNVYIMNGLYSDGDLYNSGVAWLPNDWMTANNLARVVYNGSFLGVNTDENFRRVLTHEFGHFLGLHHTFEGGCKMPNDGVEDTPAVATSHWPKDDKNCFGQYTDWENFMNYSTAYRHFTAGQVELMEKYLSEPARSTLWQESNLKATGTNDGFVPQPAVIASGKVFNETIDNKGEVDGLLKLNAHNGLTFAKTGKADETTDYEITGLPEGLTPYLYISSETVATLRLNGTAKEHAQKNSNENVSVKLKSSLVNGANGQDQSFEFAIYFNDPYTSLCSFEPRFSPYAHISCVKFRQIENYTSFDGQQWKEFNQTHVAGLEIGETYTLTATVQNWNSGANDSYKVRIWFDWDGDFVLQQDELVDTKLIERIGTAGTEHEVTFEVTVPDHVVTDREFSWRIMLHYYERGLDSDGEDPCGVIDSGDVEDYGAVIGEGHALPPNKDVEPEEEVCYPEFSYKSYAYISKVEFNGMVNEISAQPNEGRPIEDFREDQSLQVTLMKGKTYEMKVTCNNLDSHEEDPYKIRAYIDWNNNNVLEMEEHKQEAQKIDIPQIGLPSNPYEATFNFTVPTNAVKDKPLHMRVFLHYGSVNSMAGELPCGTVENGQLHDYYVFVEDDPVGIDDLQAASVVEIYPNPTKGLVNIVAETLPISYQLYRIDGQIVQEGAVSNSQIDISGNSGGMYILKLQLQDKEIQKIVILN